MASFRSLVKVPQQHICGPKMSTRQGAVLSLIGSDMLLWGCRAENGVSLEWSPDGRHLLTATTAPRLRVDNGYQMYKCASSSKTCSNHPGAHTVRRVRYSEDVSACKHLGYFALRFMMSYKNN